MSDCAIRVAVPKYTNPHINLIYSKLQSATKNPLSDGPIPPIVTKIISNNKQSSSIILAVFPLFLTNYLSFVWHVLASPPIPLPIKTQFYGLNAFPDEKVKNFV
jgi:hypothetical protein